MVQAGGFTALFALKWKALRCSSNCPSLGPLARIHHQGTG